MVILHRRAASALSFTHSDLPASALVEESLVTADQEPLAKMLAACERAKGRVPEGQDLVGSDTCTR